MSIQGNNGETWRFTISDQDGNLLPFNRIATATLYFIQQSGTSPASSKACTLDTGTQTVSALLNNTDLAVPGWYDLQLYVTLTDGTAYHTNPVTHIIRKKIY